MDPVIGKPPPPTPHPAPTEQGEEEEDFSEHALDAAAVVDQYLDDEERPGDRTLPGVARAALERDIRTRLGEGLTPAQVWRAWELLKAERGWKNPKAKRLGWLCAVAGRIEERFEQAGEAFEVEELEHTTIPSTEGLPPEVFVQHWAPAPLRQADEHCPWDKQ